MIQQRWFETLLGFCVLMVAALFFIWALNNSGDDSTIGTQKMMADFPSIKGLQVGNDIRIGGVKVGSVSQLSVNPENFQARVVMALRDDLRLPEDSAVAIISDGLLGGAYIRLEPGQSKNHLNPEGQFKNIKRSLSLEELLGKAVFIISETSSQQ